MFALPVGPFTLVADPAVAGPADPVLPIEARPPPPPEPGRSVPPPFPPPMLRPATPPCPAPAADWPALSIRPVGRSLPGPSTAPVDDPLLLRAPSIATLSW